MQGSRAVQCLTKRFNGELLLIISSSIDTVLGMNGVDTAHFGIEQHGRNNVNTLRRRGKW